MVGIFVAKLNDPAKKTHIFPVNKITNTINCMGLKLRGGSNFFLGLSEKHYVILQV